MLAEALFVYVNISTWFGRTPWLRMKWLIRSVSVSVLPVPGPASISSRLLSRVTASCWEWFKSIVFALGAVLHPFLQIEVQPFVPPWVLGPQLDLFQELCGVRRVHIVDVLDAPGRTSQQGLDHLVVHTAVFRQPQPVARPHGRILHRGQQW